VRRAFDRRASRGFGPIHGYGHRRGGFGRVAVFYGEFWPGNGDGPATSVEILEAPGYLADPTVLDLPAVPGIRPAPRPEPASLTIDRDHWRGPRRVGAKILSRRPDGEFEPVEGSGEATGGASGPKIIHLPVPVGR